MIFLNKLFLKKENLYSNFFYDNLWVWICSVFPFSASLFLLLYGFLQLFYVIFLFNRQCKEMSTVCDISIIFIKRIFIKNFSRSKKVFFSTNLSRILLNETYEYHSAQTNMMIFFIFPKLSLFSTNKFFLEIMSWVD